MSRAAFDGEAFGRQMLDAVKGYVQPLKAELAAAKSANLILLARLEALETRAAVPGPAGPQGEAGADGAPGLDGHDGAPGPQGAAGKDGAAGPQGAAGKDGTPGPQGAAGSEGASGTDGAPGLDGQHGERGASGEKGLDGKDGRDGQAGVPGRDGKDGLGFDDLDIEHDGERGFRFVLVRGDRRKEFGPFTVPAMIYRGVWAEQQWSQGDAVTWRGSLWVAKTQTSSKPDEANSHWVLSCKKGRDGKDAVRMAGVS